MEPKKNMYKLETNFLNPELHCTHRFLKRSSLNLIRQMQQSLGDTYGGILIGNQAGKRVSSSAWGKSPSTKKDPSIYNSSCKEKTFQKEKNNVSMVGIREREHGMEEMVTQLSDPAPTQSKYQPETVNQ
ncbi:hypothetical protein HHI36_012896 [Cryptolaemus montrouzieri]|uniref:Uncharacterized protein n=1 Tax=Cryptolaemus montrouzieri TaxID=559131 RepID=A0ABD2NFS5_9CUCU